MAYELWNPHTADMEFTMGNPIGTIRIKSRTYFPSPEQEEVGIRAKDFHDLIGPSFLAPTPNKDRRRLLEAAHLPVPQVVLDATRHLPEYKGKEEGTSVVAGAAAPAIVKATAGEALSAAEKLKAAGLGKFVPQTLGDELQAAVDSKCSSNRDKRPSVV